MTGVVDMLTPVAQQVRRGLPRYSLSRLARSSKPRATELSKFSLFAMLHSGLIEGIYTVQPSAHRGR